MSPFLTVVSVKEKVCQTAWKIFQFLQKKRPSFSSKNCQFIDFYNTYFLNGLVNPALKVAIYGSRFTLLTTSFGQNQVDLQLAVLFHNNFVLVEFVLCERGPVA